MTAGASLSGHADFILFSLIVNKSLEFSKIKEERRKSA
jgi:hypothetical protein